MIYRKIIDCSYVAKAINSPISGISDGVEERWFLVDAVTSGQRRTNPIRDDGDQTDCDKNQGQVHASAIAKAPPAIAQCVEINHYDREGDAGDEQYMTHIRRWIDCNKVAA